MPPKNGGRRSAENDVLRSCLFPICGYASASVLQTVLQLLGFKPLMAGKFTGHTYPKMASVTKVPNGKHTSLRV